jgi:uncharacterized membrane protein affecting hemolysin expression
LRRCPEKFYINPSKRHFEDLITKSHFFHQLTVQNYFSFLRSRVYPIVKSQTTWAGRRKRRIQGPFLSKTEKERWERKEVGKDLAEQVFHCPFLHREKAFT